jgi:hypothetical protein
LSARHAPVVDGEAGGAADEAAQGCGCEDQALTSSESVLEGHSVLPVQRR